HPFPTRRSSDLVLQNQYWDLAPGETFFSVTLKFGGQPKSLSIPYSAITRFYDPSVQYLLQFSAAEEPQIATPATPVPPKTEKGAAVPAPDAPKVVSLDQFRKK